MADHTNDQTLAIIAAGVLASGTVPLGPQAGMPQEKPDWGTYADQLKQHTVDDAELSAVVAIAKHVHEKLYPSSQD